MSHRQLAAIMFADIVGYTTLMQEDEDMAMLLREKFNRTINIEVDAHRGRILKRMGDGALCIFNSSIEAVRAGLKIQSVMREEPSVPLRIGIHSGDVIIDELDVYGDGVNIASRVESFTIPGGIFISGKVYDDIKNHKEIQTVSVGRYELKNVKNPIEIFAISNPGIKLPGRVKTDGKGYKVATKRKRMAMFLWSIFILIIAAVIFFANKKLNGVYNKTDVIRSIAVLPFRNESTAKEENEAFCNGMMESVLNNLARVEALRVISRQSVEQYRDSRKPISQIAEELGVGYILSGSVQRFGNQLKVTAQLISAEDERHLWSDEYPGELRDIFKLQSDIAKEIASALNVNIRPEEKLRIERVPTKNLTAWDEYQKALSGYTRFVFSIDHKAEDYEKIMSLCERAIYLDPQMAEAYTLKAKTYWGRNYNKSILKANEEFLIENSLDTVAAWCRKALSIDKNSADANILLAQYYFNTKKPDSGIVRLQQTLSVNPSHSAAHNQLGDIYLNKGNNRAAFVHYQKAVQLDPFSVWTPFYYNDVSWVYTSIGDFRKAERLYLKSIKTEKSSSAAVEAYTYLTHLYTVENKADKVMETAEKWLQLDSTALRSFGEYYYMFKKDYAKSNLYFRELHQVKPNTSHVKMRWGHALWLWGKRDTATILFNEQIAEFQKQARFERTTIGGFDYDYAGIYLTMNQKEKAYQYLRRFDNAGWPWGSIYLVQHDPFFDPLRKDKEFNEMVQRALKAKEKQRKEILELEEGELM